MIHVSETDPVQRKAKKTIRNTVRGGISIYRRTYIKPREAAAEKNPVSRLFPTMAMTVDEMAEELHISRPTDYELVKQEYFPAFRIGNRILVNRQGLQEWMNRESRAPLEQPG